MMQWKPISLALLPAALLLVLLAGCRTQTVAPAPLAVLPLAAEEKQYVELTYPQSDDQGHYLGLPKTGNVTVSGIVAALSPPTGVVVNGVTVEPYPVEYVPLGTPAGYQSYGFSAPMALSPSTLLSVAIQVLGGTTPPVTFTPDASSTYSRLLALAGVTPETSSAQYRLANALLARNEYDEALAKYRRSVALEPQFAFGHDGLGQTYVLMQRPSDAVIHFKKATELHPMWADSRYRLAQVYTSQRKYDDAILEYREALKISPTHPGLHLGYAVALHNRGHYAEAWQQVQTAEKAGANYPADLKQKLQAKLSELDGKEVDHDRGQQQTKPDQKRQDGLRRPGPHAQQQTDKPQKRQDGVRAPGPHASEQQNERSKGN